MKLAFELEVPDGAVDKTAEAELVRAGKEQALLALPASKNQCLAGDPAGVVGRKEHSGAGDVFRLCDAA